MWKRAVVLAWVLMIACQAGCGTKSTVMEEDRQGIDVEEQIIEAQDAEFDRLEQALKDDPVAMTAAAPILARMREKNSDGKKITKQLLSNFGPPEKPIPYAHAEVEGLLARMAKSHAVTFWASVGGALLTGMTLMLGLIRSPAARMIPGVGPIFAALDSTAAAIESYIAKKRAGGHVDDAAELQNVLQQAHKVDKVGAFMDRLTDKVKEKTGIDASKVLSPQEAATATPTAVAASTAVLAEVEKATATV
jgi:hypothetical protein